MNPLVRRFGGKFYSKNKILPHFPKQINDYVEPFLGGGSIFLNLKREGISVKTTCYLNDLDGDIFNVWKCFNAPLSFRILMMMFGQSNLYSQGVFEYLKQTVYDDRVARAWQFMMLTMMSFQGRAEKYFIGVNDVNRKNNRLYRPEDYWEAYHNYLVEMNVKVSNCDYLKLLTGPLNRPSTFIYCDPPFFGTKGYPGLPFDVDNHYELYSVLKNFKGKWALSYNNVPWVLEIYKDYRIVPIETRYAGNAHSDKNKGVKNVLIMNYEEEGYGLCDKCEFERPRGSMHKKCNDCLWLVNGRQDNFEWRKQGVDDE